MLQCLQSRFPRLRKKLIRRRRKRARTYPLNGLRLGLNPKLRRGGVCARVMTPVLPAGVRAPVPGVKQPVTSDDEIGMFCVEQWELQTSVRQIAARTRAERT